MSQTVALILQSKPDADRIEYALAAAGFLIAEVRPSVFSIERIPKYLRPCANQAPACDGCDCGKTTPPTWGNDHDFGPSLG
jgi:hypothetical protein